MFRVQKNQLFSSGCSIEINLLGETKQNDTNFRSSLKLSFFDFARPTRGCNREIIVVVRYDNGTWLAWIRKATKRSKEGAGAFFFLSIARDKVWKVLTLLQMQGPPFNTNSGSKVL